MSIYDLQFLKGTLLFQVFVFDFLQTFRFEKFDEDEHCG